MVPFEMTLRPTLVPSNIPTGMKKTNEIYHRPNFIDLPSNVTLTQAFTYSFQFIHAVSVIRVPEKLEYANSHEFRLIQK